MQLYGLPLSCSLATRIALLEAGAPFEYVEVDGPTKRTLGGADYREIHPLGLVPALRTDDGQIVIENAAVLQYVADLLPAAELAPPAGSLERVRLQQWLGFIGTELHKGLFAPLFAPDVPEAVRAYALAKGTSRLDYVARHLEGREFLLDRFSVADAYLVTVLAWTLVTPIDLKQWPSLAAYARRLHARPSVAAAFHAERKLYTEELARHGKPLPAALRPRAD
ncbi:glutathione S-transferase N-terminal domain-containing protein [Nannocystis bainbridge]|uniref:Glutathione S-transferase N-terminal domain-containing protein n=1 Tax=Nannocystis bainbridge TaxID=2995303 RepID=A0ABT5DQS2_9BACT|nr:glutathione S-transferase N-terminal domain-containing protein [Nannocystis bainbridge]MDC0715980.1 glutathione S-transferase N-terminal domain-containing protein [Nannocystis bainbridge]